MISPQQFKQGPLRAAKVYALRGCDTASSMLGPNMALSFTRSVGEFLNKQIFRNDYIIIDEQAPGAEPSTAPAKLDRLHTLCVDNGYQSLADCQRIRHELLKSTDLDPTPESVIAMLQAYLPHCVYTVDSTDVFTQAENADKLQQFLSSANTPQHYRSSCIQTNQYRHYLRLPSNVHALLIDNDSALLAA